MPTKQASGPRAEAHQTVRLKIDTHHGTSSIRTPKGFGGQRLIAHGGLCLWPQFLHQPQLRRQLEQILAHTPTSPNAFDPTEIALGLPGEWDSWALLHEDGHREGVADGYTRRGLKPCHRPLLAAWAEEKLVVHYRLRPGGGM